MKGIGKGLVGAVAQPVSGGLDLFSSAFEGLDASKDQLLGKPRASILLRRKRLPRVVGGDGKLQPFVRDGSERQVLHLSTAADVQTSRSPCRLPCNASYGDPALIDTTSEA